MDTLTMWARDTMEQTEAVEGLVRFLKKMGCGAERPEEDDQTEPITLLSAVRFPQGTRPARVAAESSGATTKAAPSREKVALADAIRISCGIFAKV